jgi:hypothetical protein
MNGHQREQAGRFGVEVIEMKDLKDGLVLQFDTPVYVSVDMDGSTRPLRRASRIGNQAASRRDKCSK